MPSFYNGKRFFLTYAQCPESIQECIAFLQSKGDLKYYLVCAEKHQDGSPHLHACVEFKTHQRKPVDWLDFNGKHPNKQDPRVWQACRAYCKKDGDFLEGPEEEETVDIYEKCKQFDNEEDWMAHCASTRVSFQYAVWFWSRVHQDTCTILTNEHEGVMHQSLIDYPFDAYYHRCLILRGPTGCGKTTWAKRNMPLPILFVSHIDKLGDFRAGYHKSIIFDDVDFNHYPRTSQIHLTDWENPRQIHIRHRVANIPAGVFKCFTCNNWPLGEYPEVLRRVRRVSVQ